MKRRKRYKQQPPVVERIMDRVEDAKPYARDMKAYYNDMDYHKKRRIKSTFSTIIALIASYKLFKRLRHNR